VDFCTAQISIKQVFVSTVRGTITYPCSINPPTFNSHSHEKIAHRERRWAMKVYGPAASTNVARVLVCLEEVGAEYELVPVDMPSGEHKSPAHVARNPFGQVPAFQDGDLILSESRAISKYILRKGGSDLI
ncbi:unnamed protein product, partial [Urochloa humidicola]